MAANLGGVSALATSQSSDALRVLAEKLGYPFVDLEPNEVSLSALALVPEVLARKERFVPLALEGETLRVAMSQPPARETLDRLVALLKRPVAVSLATEEAILAAMDRFYRLGSIRAAGVSPRADDASAAAPEEPIDFVEVAEGQAEAAGGGETPDPDGAAVVRLVQTIISDGFRLGASRILILPMPQRLKVAYRIQDAVCSPRDYPPEMHYPVLVRLMAMANLSGFIKVVTGERERRVHAVFKPARHGLSALLEMGADASAIEATRARAAKLGYAFLPLDDQQVPKSVLATVPEAVAREHRVLPVALDGNTLTLVTGTAMSPETLDRLQFILNRPIALAMAPEGAVLAAIDRHYGSADPETADLMLWELAQSPEPAGAGAAGGGHRSRWADAPVPSAATPLLDYLRTFYRDGMFECFDSLREAAALCRQDPVSGDLDVVFPQSHLMPQMPAAARRYLENKVWVLREAIISRLEHFLEKDAVARRVAMTYSQYLACCQLAEGHRVPINPASSPDAWLNFLYGLIIRSFPSIDSNGALLSFVNEHLDQLSEKVASLLDDPELTVRPSAVREQLAELERQTTLDEAIDYDSPPIVHLVELLIAEAVHLRASQVAIVPLEDRLEVAHQIQGEAYLRQTLPLRRLYPLLARLRMFAELSGEMAITVGKKERRLHVGFHATPHGLAAVVEIAPDTAAIEACKAQAAAAGCPFVRLQQTTVPPALLRPIPKAVAWKKKFLPLALQEGTLMVAVPCVPTPRRLDELRLIFKRPVTAALAPEDDILAAIYRHYHPAAAEPSVSETAKRLLGLAPSEPTQT